MTYLRYAPSVEETAPDEPELFKRIAETFAAMGRTVAAQEGRAMRVSHAKPTALLTATLAIDADLPPELAQGIASRPRGFDALVRFAQGPGENLHDRISTHRGVAVKLLAVGGEHIAESDGAPVQDFVLEASGKVFINATARAFLANLRMGVSNAPSLSESVKHAVSKTARAAEGALEAVGVESTTLAFFGHPPRHPLAESYFSQVPLRWGEHVAKIGLFPSPATIERLAALTVDTDRDHDAFRTAMVQHFSVHGAEFELRVQLATDLATTPVENAAREWPEAETPYRRVGILSLPPQPAWSPARDAYFEALSFRPANSLCAHRPLGQIMRARLFVYGRLAALRRGGEAMAQAAPSPRALADVPA